MKDLIESHWDKSARGYSKFVICSMQSQRRNAWKSALQNELGERKLKVLDVGTGPGIIAFILAELGHQVTAVDLSEEMLKSARENASRFGFSVIFKRGDAENLQFKEGSFDAVINRELFWTLPDPEKVAYEWVRVLKPNGKIIIIDGNWYSKRKDTLKTKLWRKMALPLIMLTERPSSAPRNYDEELLKKLPMINRDRPNYDLSLLESLDLKDVHAKNMSRKEEGFLEYLKYGYWGDQFLVSGTKPNKNG